MKLTKGTLKVIVTDPAAILDNPKRARAGGKIFMPPYVIYERNDDLNTVDKHYAFGFSSRVLRPRYSHTRFPYAWAPTSVKDTRCWIETTDELTLVTHYED